VHNVTVESDRYIATQQGKLRCVEILVNARANVNCAKRANGSTALYVTAKEGHAKCMELLLMAGANMNATMANGQTLLMALAQKGSANGLRSLLGIYESQRENTSTPSSSGAATRPCVGATTADGTSALFIAASGGHLDFVRLLVQS
jgi:ankyrin repeat protein